MSGYFVQGIATSSFQGVVKMRSHSIPAPIENSYWVVPGKLLAGEYPRTTERAASI